MLIKNIITYDDFINNLKKYNLVIVNISASWCRPCIALKPNIEKFLSVIDKENIIYLKLDHSIYEFDVRFETLFNVGKIPYFAFIKDGKLIDSFVSGDFDFVSKRLFENISKEKNIDNNINNDIDNNNDVIINKIE